MALHLDVQTFTESGTWVKPAGAVRVDLLMCGGSQGGLFGIDGQLACRTLDAADLPSEIEVDVGHGGRDLLAPGADGYAVVVTHLK